MLFRRIVRTYGVKGKVGIGSNLEKRRKFFLSIEFVFSCLNAKNEFPRAPLDILIGIILNQAHGSLTLYAKFGLFLTDLASSSSFTVESDAHIVIYKRNKAIQKKHHEGHPLACPHNGCVVWVISLFAQ